MTVRPIDTLLAIKVVGLIEGLNGSDRRVAILLLEHFNRKDGRCDPSLARVAGLLGISERTVIRSVRRREHKGLFRKVRHGGRFNTNRYEPIWSRFEQHHERWREQFNLKRKLAATDPSPGSRQTCHVGDDTGVTQTYGINLRKETCVGLPKEERSNTHNTTSTTPVSGNRSADVASAEAERRWTNDLHQQFSELPITYGEVIEAITPEIQSAATAAELKRRGSGLAYILYRLKIGATR